MIFWMKSLKLGVGCWLLLHHMTWKSGGYSRPRVLQKSWRLFVEPSPLPVFEAWSCVAGWYVVVGWFRLFLARHKPQEGRKP